MPKLARAGSRKNDGWQWAMGNGQWAMAMQWSAPLAGKRMIQALQLGHHW